MRVAQRPNSRRQVSRTASISSPVAGLNAISPISEMQDKDAVILDNFFCTPYDVMVRSGYSNQATGIPGTVNSIFSYSPVSGALKLFAAAGASIFDVTATGPVGAASVTGLTSDKWQYINFGTAGGNFLLAVNGADKLRGYNGTAWWVDGDGTHDITGLDTSTVNNIYASKSRVWLIQKNTLKVWYLPVLSIAGAATAIDFSSILNRGGYLVSMCSWTLDAGYGMDDYVAFVTSEGQVLIYKGTDPSSATTWGLIGIYEVGAPIGSRCMVKYAGDVLLICQDGLAPLSKALMSSRVNSQEMLTYRVQHIISDYVSQYGSIFGWETTLFPKENMLILNVPISASKSYQLVMNTISGAWSRFTGWNASCMELHGNNIYFGTNGAVCQAWNTQSDNGANISYEALQSFNYFGGNDQLKMIKMVRPIISTNGSPSLLMGVNVDFDTSAPTGVPSFTPNASGTWDSAVWDTDVWGGDLLIKRDWQTAFGIGYCVAAHMKGAISGIRLRWSSTDYLFESGGVL